MLEIAQLHELRAQLGRWRGGERIAFVPTMGNLHRGHLALVKQAQSLARRVVVSIFVNPLQFGAGEDFNAYPRTLDDDRNQLALLGTDLLFVPLEAELYPAGREQTTRVSVPQLSDILCGAYRPGHFEGVATVVTKLLNLVQPDLAIFGKKDYQQLLVIRALARDLNLPVQIVAGETVREADGLAMSSRNRYLDTARRQVAPLLYRELRQIADAVAAGDTDYAGLQEIAVKNLRAAGFVPDYVQVRRRADLAPPQPGEGELIVLAAARLGPARLIDNVEIGF